MTIFKKTQTIALLYLVGLFLFISPTHAQQYKMGLKLDKRKYAAFSRKSAQAKMGELPQQVSYEAYIPPIGNQGDYGTCVGFSTAYYYRTMVDAIQRKTTTQATIGQWLYSPSDLYNRIKESSDVNCKEGAFPGDAFEKLINEGVATFAQVGYPNCGSGNASRPSSSRISSAAAVIEPTEPSNQKILNAKKALADGFPIVIGMLCPPSFHTTKDVWTPTPEEIANIDRIPSGHALTVIGYDDFKHGGAFRILNSWGTAWGQNGLCWMRYEDFGRFVMFAFEGFPLPDNNPPPTAITLSGETSFQLLGGGAVPVQRSVVAKGTTIDDDPNTVETMVAYQLSNPYNSGTRFKFSAKINKQAYVYVIGSDLNNSTNVLFPVDASTNAAFGANTLMTLPSTTKNYTLDANTGTDYWLFLYSETPLDIASITSRIKASSGSFSDRIMSVLGRELVEVKDIQYFSDRVGFDLRGNPKGSVVPLLVSLKHI